MRYQPLSRRLINLIYPLVIYMAIGMAVLGLYPNGGLMANLIEKSPDILSRLKNVISGFKSGKDNDKGENVTAEGAPEKDL